MSKQKEHFDVKRLNQINIYEVARRLGVKLYRAGIYYKTCCPWHPDKNPSLVLYNRRDDQHCHCYACGAHHSVIDLAKELGNWSFEEACKWLSQEFGIGTSTSWYYTPTRKLQTVSQPESHDYHYIPIEMAQQIVSENSSLCLCLMHMAHSSKALWTTEAVEWLGEEYMLGCYAMWDYEDYIVFPCIDWQGRLCNLKAQHYDCNPHSPRFGHDDKGQSYWLGKMWLKDGKLKFDDGKTSDGICFRNNCLFGEHLILQYTSATIALVESPKNALFGALAMPEMVWIATGNKTNLNRQVLEPLRGRDVIVFPDRDAIPLWTDTLKDMADLANFTVSDFCETNAPEGQQKFDVADYLQGEIMGV